MNNTFFIIIQKILLVFIFYFIVKTLARTAIKLYYSIKLIQAYKISELRYHRVIRDMKINLPILLKDFENDIRRVGPKYYLEYLQLMFLLSFLSLILLAYLFFDGVVYHQEIWEASLLTKVAPTKSPLHERHYHNKPIFEEYFYPGEGRVLRNELLVNSIDSFSREVVDMTTPPEVVGVIVVIQYIMESDDFVWYEYRSLTTLVNIDRSLINWFKAIALHSLEEKSNYYYDHPVENIIFRYRIDRDDGFKPQAVLMVGPSKPKPRFSFGNYSLPLPNTSDFREFGTIIRKIDNVSDMSTIYDISIPNKDYRLEVTTHGDYNEIEIIREYNGVITRTSVFDYITNPHNPRTFTRVSDGREYFFIDGELEVRTIQRKTEFLKPLKRAKKIKENCIITMDLETRRDSKGLMTVYLLCFYDGAAHKSYSYYLDDYNGSVDSMITCAISDLFKTKYNNKIIYLHNFSSFDGIFLIKYFNQIENVEHKILKMESKFIEVSLTIKVKNKNLTIKFRDSMLLLPESLKKLGSTFNVESKGIFPVFFPNDNSLNYQGEVPDYKYFSKLSLEEYNQFKSEFKGQWVLKDEAIKYCIQDCKTLYQVLVRFNELIFTNFKVNIWKQPTIPSLAMSIYRTGYLGDYQIPITTGVLFEELKEGFTGGAAAG